MLGKSTGSLLCGFAFAFDLAAKMYGLRIFLCLIGLVNYIGHPQPPQLNWARVYCGCQPGPTRVALHPGRMVEEPERQPYIHWTTCYDFEEMRNIELCSYRKPSQSVVTLVLQVDLQELLCCCSLNQSRIYLIHEKF